ACFGLFDRQKGRRPYHLTQPSFTTEAKRADADSTSSTASRRNAALEGLLAVLKKETRHKAGQNALLEKL
ncbi:hypothetical protein, partial [Chromobacterium violaceum]|uniref:hypothetical protein n=1 Tax=Chromobacterium violaceum TaxID=536 RepID=UPI001A973448